MIEIERKFLVKNKIFKTEAYTSSRIKQGYIIANSEGKSVRIRSRDSKGYLTIKGASNAAGMSRFEWEKEISLDESDRLFELCGEGIIDKVRYLIKVEDHVFEVDEFMGLNSGLIIAEIELSSEEEHFEKPNWLDKEVTGDERYYNSYLSQHPFTKWKV